MSTVKSSRRAWDQVRELVASHPDPRGISIPRGSLPHPRDAGARPGTTWPVGQIADYAIEGSPGEPPLAIREFPDRWEVFIETARLTSQALDAVGSEPSMAMFVGAAMLGGSIGSSVSNKRSGMIVGAALGLLFAAALATAIEDKNVRRRMIRTKRRQA